MLGGGVGCRLVGQLLNRATTLGGTPSSREAIDTEPPGGREFASPKTF